MAVRIFDAFDYPAVDIFLNRLDIVGLREAVEVCSEVEKEIMVAVIGQPFRAQRVFDAILAQGTMKSLPRKVVGTHDPCVPFGRRKDRRVPVHDEIFVAVFDQVSPGIAVCDEKVLRVVLAQSGVMFQPRGPMPDFGAVFIKQGQKLPVVRCPPLRKKPVGAYARKILAGNREPMVWDCVNPCQHLVFGDFCGVRLYVLAVDPVKNAEDCPVEHRIQAAVFCLADFAYEVDAVVAQVLDYGETASIDIGVGGRVNQFGEITAPCRVYPPCFAIIPAFGGGNAECADIVFLPDKTFQAAHIFIAAMDIAVHFLHFAALSYEKCSPNNGKSLEQSSFR